MHPRPMHPTLPVRLCLAPHRSVLVVVACSRRLGLDPDAGLVVDGLHPALALMLDELDGAVEVARLVAGAERRGAPAGAVENLLRRLLDADALVDARAPQRSRDRRAGSTVLVVGDGPLTAGIVTGLVQAGVGTVHVTARGTVREADLGTGLLDADRGRDRGTAIGAAAARLVPGAGVGPPPRRSVPDLVVFGDAQAPDPEAVARLVVDGAAHLLVRLRDGTGVVGPLVLPGRTACLRCLELRRSERDPGWPGVAAQLVGRSGRADPACVSATAAFGTAQVLAFLDGTAAPGTLNCTIELDVGAATTRHRRWSPHPTCTCGAAAAGGGPRHPWATCAAPRTRGTMRS